ncbi:SGNH/GDSL hydrolase family protein [Planctomycetota bacterium]
MNQESKPQHPTTVRQARQRLSWQKRLLFLCIMGIFLLLFLEGTMRLYVAVRFKCNWNVYDIWNSLYQWNPYSYYQVKPNSHFELYGGDYVIDTDANGFRSPEPKTPKPANSFRIAFLGGSTTFGIEASGNETTYPYMVQKILQENYREKDIEILNAAAPGYNSLQSFSVLVSRVLPLNVDLIVVYHGCNDASVRTVTDYREDYSHHAAKTFSTSHQNIFYQKSILYRFLVYKMLLGHARNISKLPGSPGEYRRVLREHTPITFERNLRNMAAVAKAHDIKIILCTFAYCIDAAGKTKKYMPDTWQYIFQALDQNNDVVRKVAEEENVPLLDMAKLYPAEKKYFIDESHRNEAGLRLHTKILTDFITAQNIIE